MSLVTTRRNECLKLIRPSNRKINVIRTSTGESKTHQKAKYLLCQKLLKEGKHFITEAIFTTGGRADILVLDDFTIWEILHTETTDQFKNKCRSYPKGLLCYGFKATDVIAHYKALTTIKEEKHEKQARG